VLSQFFGDAPEDQEVGGIVRRAIEDMKAAGAAAVEVAVPDLTAQLMASNLLVQELKFYLGAYLKNAPGSPVKSVSESKSAVSPVADRRPGLPVPPASRLNAAFLPLPVDSSTARATSTKDS